jgi:organic hydroperoxide reductase OsmC/OhrA
VTRAHRDCFVANSVSTPIEITPTFVFGEASALR